MERYRKATKPEPRKAMQILRKAIKAPLVWVVALTIAYLIILATRPAEAFFGVPGQWTWSGRPPSPATAPRWWPAIAALAATAGAGVILDPRWAKLSKAHRAAALGFLAAMAPVTQILLKFIHYRYPIEYYLYRTIGPHNGFWQAAISIGSVGEYLRTYPQQMQAAAGVFGHLTTHPPTNILYVWLWRQGFAAFPGAAHTVAHWLRGFNCADFAFVTLGDAQIAAALGQMVLPLWSGLTVIPLYAWGKRIGGPQAGWRTAALFALTPALSLFTMRWDTLYPLFAAAAFALLQQGLEAGKVVWWFLSGFAVSLASSCSFGNATLAPGVALYALGYLWMKRPSAILQAWRGWAALLLGGYSVWGIYQVAAGLSIWELLSITGAIQSQLRAAYSYGLWLFYDAVDILAFAGVPVGTVFVIEAVRAWKSAPRRKTTVALLPALAVSGALLAVNFAGVSPGEVGRLWMFWTTGMALTTVLWLQRQEPKTQRWGYALMMTLMALQSLWVTLFLRVSPTGMPGYHPREPVAATAPASDSPDVTFGEDIQLVGYTLKPENVTPGSTVEATLYWRARSRPDLPYTVFVHLLDQDGVLQAQGDSMPAGGDIPTSCWLPGEVVQDTHILTAPVTAPQGTYSVRVGLYYWPTMDRLPITAGGVGDAATLSTHLSLED